ncbi:MAG: hypothetical protein K0S45_3624 [Nitrospira sp.]|nr:hypothetical protein [Nitrospira sp.]
MSNIRPMSTSAEAENPLSETFKRFSSSNLSKSESEWISETLRGPVNPAEENVLP